MTFYPNDRIALFIDGSNLHSATRSLGFDIDYKKLLEEFRRRGVLVRAYYYTAVFEDQGVFAPAPLIDWLDYNGFTVVTKPAKRYVEQGTARGAHQGQHGYRDRRRHDGDRPQARPHRAVLRRRRLPAGWSRRCSARAAG